MTLVDKLGCMSKTETAAKWMFWLGVVMFIGGALTTSPVATPVSFFFPLLFLIPYVWVQVKKGVGEADTTAPTKSKSKVGK